MTTAATEISEPLAAYRPGSSFFFASPAGTLLAQGRRAAVRAWSPGTTVVGALPFDTAAPPALYEPAVTHHYAPAAPSSALRPAPAARVTLRPEPPPAEYERAVHRALLRLAETPLAKVVLARTLHVACEDPVDVPRLLRTLAAGDPRGHAFAVSAPERETLVGVSPELLVSRRGRAVVSHPLAGSAARSHDPAEDQTRAAALLDSAKDLREHAIVVEAVAEALSPYCARLEVPRGPALVATATMWHLGTRVTGYLDDPDVDALTLARALHPTPAVCGTPTALAREAIAELEPFDRGLYGGAVGWCDGTGDGEWAVALRCAEVRDDGLRLFAGAGIVPGSAPADELAETTAKFRTMLRALDLDGEGR